MLYRGSNTYVAPSAGGGYLIGIILKSIVTEQSGVMTFTLYYNIRWCVKQSTNCMFLFFWNSPPPSQFTLFLDIRFSNISSICPSFLEPTSSQSVHPFLIYSIITVLSCTDGGFSTGEKS